jgi:aldehyde:ferredoxin oxidoreductase
MRNSVAAMAIGIAAMLAGGQAEAAKKIHRSHNAYQSRGPVMNNPDPSGGNAAAGGNNANSMNGYNSAGENPEGRTGGGRN